MITLQQVLGMVSVAIVLLVIPGPSVLFVTSRAVALGRRAGVATAVGNALGLCVQGAAVSIGLGALVERSLTAFTVIKLVGAAYLIYLGIQAIRHRRQMAENLIADVAPLSLGRIVVQGAVVGVTNPKGFLILAAVLPQFIVPAIGPAPLQMLQLVGICIALGLTTDTCWALLAGTARAWFVRSPRRLQAVGGGSGVVMIGLGVRLAVTGRGD